MCMSVLIQACMYIHVVSRRLSLVCVCVCLPVFLYAHAHMHEPVAILISNTFNCIRNGIAICIYIYVCVCVCDCEHVRATAAFCNHILPESRSYLLGTPSPSASPSPSTTSANPPQNQFNEPQHTNLASLSRTHTYTQT